MQVQDLLARARSAIGTGVKYRLGAGGMNPGARSPADGQMECDCSGFVCWALGLARETRDPFYIHANGGWINTDAIVLDGHDGKGIFTALPQPRVGCLIVYPK